MLNIPFPAKTVLLSDKSITISARRDDCTEIFKNAGLTELPVKYLFVKKSNGTANIRNKIIVSHTKFHPKLIDRIILR